jgi:hypothetical protein
MDKRNVNLQIEPLAKDLSLFSADAPLRIQGPFNDLSVNTDVGQALLSLATPIETQEAEPADCQALFERARQDQQSARP